MSMHTIKPIQHKVRDVLHCCRAQITAEPKLHCRLSSTVRRRHFSVETKPTYPPVVYSNIKILCQQGSLRLPNQHFSLA